MNFTIDQIIEHQERLEREIAERQSLLAAFKVLFTYVKSTQGSKSIDLGLLVSTLTPSAPACLLQEAPATPPPEQKTLPSPAPAKPYVHPDLELFQKRFGGMGGAVSWAIERMTGNYSLRDIHALLIREGFLISPSQVSVVLNRMKNRGEIECIQDGYGPTPDVYGGPEPTIPLETPATDVTSEQGITSTAVGKA